MQCLNIEEVSFVGVEMLATPLGQNQGVKNKIIVQSPLKGLLIYFTEQG